MGITKQSVEEPIEVALLYPKLYGDTVFRFKLSRVVYADKQKRIAKGFVSGLTGDPLDIVAEALLTPPEGFDDFPETVRVSSINGESVESSDLSARCREYFKDTMRGFVVDAYAAYINQLAPSTPEEFFRNTPAGDPTFELLPQASDDPGTGVRMQNVRAGMEGSEKQLPAM